MKISTKYIKDQINSWLSTSRLRKMLDNYYSEEGDAEELSSVAESFGLKLDSTCEQVYDKVHQVMCDGKQWSRQSKARDIDLELQWISEEKSDEKASYGFIDCEGFSM